VITPECASVEYDDDAKKGERVLKTLTDANGGTYFRTDRDGDLGGTFAKIRRDCAVNTCWRIGHRTSQRAHFITSKVLAHRKLHVRCRSGLGAMRENIIGDSRGAGTDQALWPE